MSKATVLDNLRLLSTEELLALAVGNQRLEGSDGEDLGALVVLHQRASLEVFTAAAALSGSSDPSERAVCARVLRELGHGQPRPFSQDAVPILAAMAQVEADPDVLQWIVSALEWQNEPATLALVLPFAHHPDSRVRHAVAVDPFAMVLDPASTDPRLIESFQDERVGSRRRQTVVSTRCGDTGASRCCPNLAR